MLINVTLKRHQALHILYLSKLRFKGFTFVQNRSACLSSTSVSIVHAICVNFPSSHLCTFQSSRNCSNSTSSQTKDINRKPSKLVPLNEQIWNIPNILTFSRILSSPFLAYAIICDHKIFALTGCVLSVFTDWLDGYIAKTYNMKTVFGSFLDPLADKIFVGMLSFALAYKGFLPIPLLGIIVFRDFFLVAGSFYKRYTEKKTGAFFFDTNSSATFIISPTGFSKLNSGLQFLVISLTIFQYGFDHDIINHVLEPLWWITGVTTVGSGLDYMVIGSGTVKNESTYDVK